MCVAIRRGLTCTEVRCDDADGVEMLCVDVLCGRSLFRFIDIYRSPQYGIEAREYVNKLVSCLKLLCQVSWPVFIVGDLNCLGIDWQSNSAPLDGVQDKLLECVEEFGFVQCVSSPTRWSNILDLVLVNEPLLLSPLSVIDPVGNSDHDSVRFCLVAESKSRVPVLPAQSGHGTDKPALSLHYSWDRADYAGFSQYLSQIDWQALISYNLTADTLWASFCNVLQAGIDMYVPTRHVDPRLSSEVKAQNYKKYPKHIRQAMSRKRCLWRVHNFTGGGPQTVQC